MAEEFANIRVVLVRPAGDLNVGSVARAMKNTGFCNLALVSREDPRTEEAFRMAVSSREILEGAKIFPTLQEAIADRQVSFGVTARHRHKRPRHTPWEAADLVSRLSSDGSKIALVFGPEDRGLSSEEIDLCRHLIGIPAHPDLYSFNLAQAVLLVCHALFMKTRPCLDEGTRPVPAAQEDRERIEAQVLDLLNASEYLTPNRELFLKDMVKRLVYRAEIESRDARHILAVVRHLRIMLGNE